MAEELNISQQNIKFQAWRREDEVDKWKKISRPAFFGHWKLQRSQYGPDEVVQGMLATFFVANFLLIWISEIDLTKALFINDLNLSSVRKGFLLTCKEVCANNVVGVGRPNLAN